MAVFLIVDDSEIILSILEKFISTHFIDSDIIKAQNGEEALHVFKEYSPSFIFLDILMPVQDGYWALEQIRQLDRDVPVVLCTSLKDDEQEQKATKLGATSIIYKPFSIDNITNVIEKYFLK